MDEQNILTKVPDNLKKLVRCTARAFYQPLQIVCLDILTKYPCVSLNDLVEVLRMHGSQKMLQQALTVLKKDMLVKCLQKVQKIESENSERQNQRVVYFYYINYKEFVNVVKYKLDQMRKKLENKGKMSQNRASYKCSSVGCSRTYSDLEVDRLLDDTGTLRCNYCRTPLEEEEQETGGVDSRTIIAQFNEYVKPIVELLRETESLNLAPELLEPEAQSIEKYLLSSGVVRRTSASSRDQGWTTHSTRDIYGSSTSVSVNIGGVQQVAKGASKERPEWLTRSTVHPSSDPVDSSEISEPPLSRSGEKTKEGVNTDILKDLMENEMKQSTSATPSIANQENITAQYSSSSSEDEAEASVSGGRIRLDEEEEESSEEDEYTIKVGDILVPLEQVTDEMVAKMTQEERDNYTEVSQQFYSQQDDYC